MANVKADLGTMAGLLRWLLRLERLTPADVQKERGSLSSELAAFATAFSGTRYRGETVDALGGDAAVGACLVLRGQVRRFLSGQTWSIDLAGVRRLSRRNRAGGVTTFYLGGDIGTRASLVAVDLLERFAGRLDRCRYCGNSFFRVKNQKVCEGRACKTALQRDRMRRYLTPQTRKRLNRRRVLRYQKTRREREQQRQERRGKLAANFKAPRTRTVGTRAGRP